MGDLFKVSDDRRDEDGAGEGRKLVKERPRPQRRLPRLRRSSRHLGLARQERHQGGRQGVMQMGAKFIKDNKLPPQTALTRTFQGMEPDEFKSLFMEGLADW